MYTYIHAYQYIYKCIGIYTYLCKNKYNCIFTYILIYTCTFEDTYIHTPIFIYSYMDVYVFVHKVRSLHIHINKYLYRYIKR